MCIPFVMQTIQECKD